MTDTQSPLPSGGAHGTPAGWYDDGTGTHRYWDGTDWTEHTHTVAAPPPRKRPVWPWILAGGVFITILGVIGGFVLFGVAIFTGISAVTDGPAAAVELHHEAYLDQDCDEYFTATTSQFRVLTGTDTCEGFVAQSRQLADTSAEWTLEVTRSSIENDTAVVITNETYIVDGTPYEATTTYELINSNGDWLILSLSADPLD